MSLDGSSLIDIGSNNGVIVSLNNDMVQEVKVQSSNFAAEYGTGGMNVSGVTKSGTSKFHGTLYDYWRDHRFAANDRSNSHRGYGEAEEHLSVSGRQHRRPDHLRRQLHQEPGSACSSSSRSRRSGSRSTQGRTSRAPIRDAMKNGDFSELLANRGSNLNSIPQLRIPQGFPNAGEPAPNNDMRPYMTATGRYFASLYPQPNYVDPANLYNYVYSRLEPTNRHDFKGRFDWTISNSTRAYVRIANEGETVESSRGVWWAPADVVALPTPNIGENKGRSYAGNIVSVLSPTMTNEVLVSYSRLTLDNHYKDPNIAHCRAPAASTSAGSSPPRCRARTCRPTCSTAGAAAARSGNLWAKANDMFAHNDALQFSNKLTKLAGSHGLKFGVSVERGQKQQNFQNLEAGQLWFGTDNDTGTGNSGADMLVGRVGQFTQGTARNGNPAPGQPAGKWRYWNFDAFAQDSWKLRSNLTLEYGVRFGYWTNNKELNGLGGYFTPDALQPECGLVPRPRHVPAPERRLLRLHRLRARTASLDNRSPFALPRVNVAWDIDGEGNNVLRGGFGMFYNRNMGNVEYDNTLRLPPNCLPGRHGFLGRRRLRRRRRPDLRHDQRGHAGQPHRQHRDQLADPGFVPVAQDEQLQHVLRPAHPVESGRRGCLRRDPAATTWSAGATATSCRMAR